MQAHKVKERDSAASVFPVETGTKLAFSTLDEEGNKLLHRHQTNLVSQTVSSSKPHYT